MQKLPFLCLETANLPVNADYSPLAGLRARTQARIQATFVFAVKAQTADLYAMGVRNEAAERFRYFGRRLRRLATRSDLEEVGEEDCVVEVTIGKPPGQLWARSQCYPCCSLCQPRPRRRAHGVRIRAGPDQPTAASIPSSNVWCRFPAAPAFARRMESTKTIGPGELDDAKTTCRPCPGRDGGRVRSGA